MDIANEPQLRWLLYTLIWTSLLWVPYIVQLILQLGPVAAIWDPTGAHPHDAAWALRAKRAHYNAVENLAIFAPLALLVHIAAAGDELTAAASATYFVARVAHYPIYIFAVPVLRTVAFLAGWAATMVLVLRLLGLL